MIRPCRPTEIEELARIINDASTAYKGVIPDDRYHEPYMPAEEVKAEMEDGVMFWGYEENEAFVAVMGIQDKGEVALIRHAYVQTSHRGRGIGGRLLSELVRKTEKPILIGTWRAAEWAIRFYLKHGFALVSDSAKERLLRLYWTIPDRQVETSVVLCEQRYAEQYKR